MTELFPLLQRNKGKKKAKGRRTGNEGGASREVSPSYDPTGIEIKAAVALYVRSYLPTCILFLSSAASTVEASKLILGKLKILKNLKKPEEAIGTPSSPACDTLNAERKSASPGLATVTSIPPTKDNDESVGER